MALKIVTGGTTGAADGTLVSSSNKLTFTALDTPINAHIRADDDTYSADTTFTVPAEVQVSFDGGTTWKDIGTNPNSYGADIGDLNVAIKLRQHSAAAASAGTFQTDATTPAATAAPNVASLTVTPGTNQNVLTWTDVANDSGYLIEQSANGSTGWSTVTTTAANATTYTHTGLTSGVAVYYRITTVGSGRYKNAATPATGNGTPTAPTTGMSVYSAAALGVSGLVSYWPLTEASGASFADSKGGYTATADATPARITGPDGSTPALNVASSASSVPKVAGFPMPGINSTAFYWFRPTVSTTDDAMALEWNRNAFGEYYQHDIGSSSHFNSGPASGTGLAMTYGVYYGADAGAQGCFSLKSSWTYSSTWYFVALVTSSGSTYATLYRAAKGAGAVTDISVTSGMASQAITHAPGGTGYLGIGGRNNAGTAGLPASAAICGLGIVNRVMTTTELNALVSAMG